MSITESLREIREELAALKAENQQLRKELDEIKTRPAGEIHYHTHNHNYPASVPVTVTHPKLYDWPNPIHTPVKFGPCVPLNPYDPMVY